MSTEKISGIIVAGGKSSRMGSDKGLLELKGKKLIQHVIDALTPVVSEIIIVANHDGYSDLGYPVYKDLYRDCGPIAGIYTGLVNSTTQKNLMVSCDIPFVSTAFLKLLIGQHREAEIIIPRHGDKLEPLCAMYDKVCAERIKNLIARKAYKMQAAFSEFDSHYMEITDESLATNFININTQDDLKKYS